MQMMSVLAINELPPFNGLHLHQTKCMNEPQAFIQPAIWKESKSVFIQRFNQTKSAGEKPSYPLCSSSSI